MNPETLTFACLLLIQMTIASCGVCFLPVARKELSVMVTLLADRHFRKGK